MIARIADAKMSFETLRPLTEPDQDFPALHNVLWGTKWDRYEYKELQRGVRGLRVAFTTAWSPPIPFLRHLLETNPSLWIKLEWKSEDVFAGVWVGYWKDNQMRVKELSWRDLCMEEEYYAFQPTQPPSQEPSSQ